MTLTNGNHRDFFQEPTQMGIPAPTVAQMATEGISKIDDLSEFREDDLKRLAENLRRPPGRVRDPEALEAANAIADEAARAAAIAAVPMIPTPAFVFGARSQKRLAVSCDLVRYHNDVGRTITAQNMQWDPIGKNFDIHWRALVARKKEDEPSVPRMTRTTSILRWAETFKEFLHRVIGIRNIPLIYCIREEATPPPLAPALATGQPFSTEHGSVENELIARASHTHPLFGNDNRRLFGLLCDALDDHHKPALSQYRKKMDGRGAWEHLITTYANRTKWETEIQHHDEFLHNRRWKCTGNQTLDHFVGLHRRAFVTLDAASKHVEFQVPNETTRVGYLLGAIECSDPGLQAAIANVKQDKDWRNDFEKTAQHLCDFDPVAKRKNSKRDVASASGLTADVGASIGKNGIGTTGVSLRYHTPSEYKNLTNDQRKELKEWREDKDPDAKKRKTSTAPKKGKNSGKQQQQLSKKQIASIISDQFQKFEKKMKAAKDEDVQAQGADEYLASLVEAVIEKKLKPSVAIADAKPSANSALKGILRNMNKKSK